MVENPNHHDRHHKPFITGHTPDRRIDQFDETSRLACVHDDKPKFTLKRHPSITKMRHSRTVEAHPIMYRTGQHHTTTPYHHKKYSSSIHQAWSVLLCMTTNPSSTPLPPLSQHKSFHLNYFNHLSLFHDQPKPSKARTFLTYIYMISNKKIAVFGFVFDYLIKRKVAIREGEY